MADWLIAHGVDESRIYREDRSTSTQENFAYSEEIMAELGLDAGDTFAFVTNDYHIFRAGRIAGTDAPAAWRRRCRAAPITMPYSSTTMCGRPLPPVGSC